MRGSTRLEEHASRSRPTAALRLLPTATIDEVGQADILCVPGGIGCVDMMEDDEVLDWVRGVGEGASG